MVDACLGNIVIHFVVGKYFQEDDSHDSKKTGSRNFL